MDWKKHIEGAFRISERFAKYGSLPVFKDPALAQEIELVESRLGCQLPNELKELLLQTNGVNGKMILSGKYTETDIFILSTKAIIETNELYRKNEEKIQPKQSFDHFVFFGEIGVDGIYFAFQIPNQSKDDGTIFAWYPIDAEFIRVAENLKDLTYNWLVGNLTL